MEGRRFGDRIILYEAERKHRQKRWVCECRCGLISIVTDYCLRIGTANRCLDCAAKLKYPPIREVGRTYNCIYVQETSGSKNGRQQYKTICACGKEKIRLGKNLRRNDKRTKECRSCANRSRWKNGIKWKNEKK